MFLYATLINKLKVYFSTFIGTKSYVNTVIINWWCIKYKIIVILKPLQHVQKDMFLSHHTWVCTKYILLTPYLSQDNKERFRLHYYLSLYKKKRFHLHDILFYAKRNVFMDTVFEFVYKRINMLSFTQYLSPYKKKCFIYNIVYFMQNETFSWRLYLSLYTKGNIIVYTIFESVLKGLFSCTLHFSLYKRMCSFCFTPGSLKLINTARSQLKLTNPACTVVKRDINWILYRPIKWCPQ